MGFPNFKNKHLFDAVFDPIDYVKHKKFTGKYPKKYVLTCHHTVRDHFIRKYHPKKIKLNHLVDIYAYKNIGLVRFAGIGCPNAAATLEELIALGGKEFINIGSAGGLQHEGLFVCTKALRDEGTSHHYLPPGKYSYPDKKLTKKFEDYLKDKGTKHFTGPTWTIDAPYRETKKEFEEYTRQGIMTVEMEAAALFAVATKRKIKIASAFIISDIPGKKNLPKFHRFTNYQKELNKLVDEATQFLIKN